jgi:hypothetical protein
MQAGRFRQVFVATLLNPKALIFALVIVSLHSPNRVFYLAAFSGLVVMVGAAWLCAGGRSRLLYGNAMRSSFGRLHRRRSPCSPRCSSVIHGSTGKARRLPGISCPSIRWSLAAWKTLTGARRSEVPPDCARPSATWHGFHEDIRSSKAAYAAVTVAARGCA